MQILLKVKDYLSQQGVQSKIRSVQALCKDVLELKDVGFSPLKASYILFSMLDTLIELNEDEDERDFPVGWYRVFQKRPFNKIVFDVLKPLPSRTVSLSSTKRKTFVTLPSGIEVAFVFQSYTIAQFADKSNYAGDTRELYVEESKVDAARVEICGLIWKSFNSRFVEINANDAVISLQATEKPLSDTEASTNITKQVGAYVSNNINRSVLLYGPPGTGKTTTAFKVCDSLGFKTLVVPVGTVSGNSMLTIFDFIEAINPDAVIFDDFERMGIDQDTLLSQFERLHRSIKLMIATVNNLGKLNKALIRPGRFDETIEVKYVDKVILEKLVGSENEDLFEAMAGWPVSFIDEFRVTNQILGKEAAKNRIRELSKRVDYQNSTYADPFIPVDKSNKKKALNEQASLDSPAAPFASCDEDYD
jgi:hypothetical protein